jgi:hypothetical protein
VQCGRHPWLYANGKRQIGQPSQGDHHDFARGAEDPINQFEHGVAPLRRGLWQRPWHITKPIGAVDLGRIHGLCKVVALAHPLIHRNVRPAGGLKDAQRIDCALGDRGIAKHRGERFHPQLRTGEAQQDGRRIVNTRIGVNNNPCGLHATDCATADDHDHAPSDADALPQWRRDLLAP